MPGSVTLRVPANYRKPVTKKTGTEQETGNTVRPVGKSHFHKLISKLEGGPYYTVVEVAWLIERTPKTVKQWIRQGKTDPPSRYLEVYGERVYLYTEEDVERFRTYSERR